MFRLGKCYARINALQCRYRVERLGLLGMLQTDQVCVPNMLANKDEWEALSLSGVRILEANSLKLQVSEEQYRVSACKQTKSPSQTELFFIKAC